ncbi:hypothetical protein J6S35_03230 [Candidatus Saccharibacteria bacterium]|nr:hypothetical protein [Candidatus Saccharibacteria bacterium]
MVNDIIKLYKNKNELKLVEIAYFFVTVLSFVIAGIIALFSQSLGVSVLIIPLIALIAGVMNIVTWALVKTGVEYLISIKEKKDDAKKTAKK